MEEMIWPDLVGPCPVSDPEGEASSSPAPAKGEPSVWPAAREHVPTAVPTSDYRAVDRGSAGR
jgi:hypothetical protein